MPVPPTSSRVTVFPALWLCLGLAVLAGCQSGNDLPIYAEQTGSAAGDEANRVQPYAANPFYWQYKGQPVLLLGGSVEDNLFQIADLEAHLDLLKSAGGNYVRSTMSSRDEGNVWPFEKDEATGRYDLDRPNAEYWNRFDTFLRLTAARDVIVQIEVWATFDFYREPWSRNPFNPVNNRNYTKAASGLPDVVSTHPTQTDNPFFFSVPEADSNGVVLPYQQAFVDRLLSYTLRYGHVLYCMDNETSVTPAWGAYWSNYIRSRAAERGLTVATTEMWDPWDLSHPMHSNTFDHPDIYTFVDVSQNNHQKGQAHWDNAQLQRARILTSGVIRPMNNVKIYGADGGRFGDDRDGIERFWRNVLGGMASARFHRPPSGLGLNETAQAHIRSARMFTDSLGVLRSEPNLAVLSEREQNEAYAMARPGHTYGIFFTDGGEVTLDVSAADRNTFRVRWLDVEQSVWKPVVEVQAEGAIRLHAPGQGYWAALVKAAS